MKLKLNKIQGARCKSTMSKSVKFGWATRKEGYREATTLYTDTKLKTKLQKRGEVIFSRNMLYFTHIENCLSHAMLLINDMGKVPLCHAWNVFPNGD